MCLPADLQLHAPNSPLSPKPTPRLMPCDPLSYPHIFKVESEPDAGCILAGLPYMTRPPWWQEDKSALHAYCVAGHTLMLLLTSFLGHQVSFKAETNGWNSVTQDRQEVVPYCRLWLGVQADAEAFHSRQTPGEFELQNVQSKIMRACSSQVCPTLGV